MGELFDGNHDVSGFSDFDIENTAFALCRGGWPEAVVESRVNVALRMAADYVEELLDSDINRMDGIKRNKTWMRLSMRAIFLLRRRNPLSRRICRVNRLRKVHSLII